MVQAFISKVFADDKFKERFASSPDAAFSEFGLNKDEGDAVLAAQRKLGWGAKGGPLEAEPIPAGSWLVIAP
ncbi:MAG: hypothetical protein KJ624_00890 [Chloroflexi bacterium]|nr:hypothetical protein [Chloroflexota bacterium]